VSITEQLFLWSPTPAKSCSESSQKGSDQKQSELSDEQAGFRKGRGTRDQITNLLIIMSKAQEHQQPLFLCYIDFRKSFDSIQLEKLWFNMLDMGYRPHVVDLLIIHT